MSYTGPDFEKHSPRGVYNCTYRRNDGLCRYAEEIPGGAFLYGGQRHCRIRPGGEDNFKRCDVGKENVVLIDTIVPLKMGDSNVCY